MMEEAGAVHPRQRHVDGGVEFGDWVEVRGRDLLRLAYVLTGNTADAEDVVQDALARALPRWERICAAEDPNAYVRRMVINAHTSWWRKFRRRELPSGDVHIDEPVAGPGEDPSHDLRRRLWNACRELPTDQRTAVVLRFYEQLGYDEIAAVTGVREGTVRSRVSRGVATLREQMGDI